MKCMKRSLLIAFCGLTALTASAEVEAKNDSLATLPDSTILLGEIAQIQNAEQLSAYRLKLQHELDLKQQENDLDWKQYEAREERDKKDENFRLFKKYFLLLVYNLLFPCAIIWLYVRHSNQNRRFKEQLLDLARSGVHVQPEIIDMLQKRSDLSNRVITGSSGKAMSTYELSYCMNRIGLAAGALGLGFAFSYTIIDGGIMFGVGTVIAVVLTLQAVVRYLLVKNSTKVKDNAE